MATTPPDLSGVVLPWQPASYWRAGDWDPSALIAALTAQPELAPYTDETGAQGRVRLDADAHPENVGYWITVPADVLEAAIDAGIAAYTPPAPPTP